jgi:hypothetical protein
LSDHALIDRLRTAVKIEETEVSLRKALRLGIVTRWLPWPVGCVEVQAKQKGLAGISVAVNHIDSMSTQEVGHVSGLFDLDFAIPKAAFRAINSPTISAPPRPLKKQTILRLRERQTTNSHPGLVFCCSEPGLHPPAFPAYRP